MLTYGKRVFVQRIQCFAKALNIRTTVLHWPVIMNGTIDWFTLEFHLVTHTSRFITTAMEMLKAFHSLYSSLGGPIADISSSRPSLVVN
jgi:hypothetical protein